MLLLPLVACSADPAPRPVARGTTAPGEPGTTQPPVPGGPPVSSAPGRSSGPAATGPPPTGRPPAPSPTRQPPEDPLASLPPLETAPPVGAPVCQAATLSVADADAVYTSDAVLELFTVRTTGPDCQLEPAYPEVQVLDAAGSSLGAVAQGGLGLPAPGPDPITLSRSTSLSFYLATTRDGSCVGATTVVVTLAGSGGALRTATGLKVCAGALAVGPVQRLGDRG